MSKEIFGWMFFVAFFSLTLILAILLGNKNIKLKFNQQIIDRYTPLALNLLNQNSSLMASARRRYIVLLLFKLLSGIFAFIFIVLTSTNILFLIGAGISILLLIYLNTKNPKKILYDIILPTLLKSYNNTIQYSHHMGISSSTYNEARFEYYDRFHSEDYMTGNVYNCSYQMSEVHTEQKYKDSDGHTHYRTVFRGTFAKVMLDKNFNCAINIVNNKIKLFNRDNYITIDNEEFEKIFDVFTTDKILAMRLLSPDVTTKMIDLYNQTGIYFEIKIIGNVMFIRLYTSSIFELSFSNSEKEAKQLASSIALLDSIYTIMNSFIYEIERIDI